MSQGQEERLQQTTQPAAQQGSTLQRSSSRADLQKFLELRALKKSKTPKFQRQESWRYVRIHEPWRKPKGVDSHMRLSIKGWPALVKIGYRGPKEARGLHPSGYRDVLVHNMAELETLSKDIDAARLAATVGRRKKIELALRAKELGIRVLNGRGLLPTEVPTTETEREEKREEEEVRATEAVPAEAKEEEEEVEEEEKSAESTKANVAVETEQVSPSTEEAAESIAAAQPEETEPKRTTQKTKPKKSSAAKKKAPKKSSSSKKAVKPKPKKKRTKKKRGDNSD